MIRILLNGHFMKEKTPELLELMKDTKNTQLAGKDAENETLLVCHIFGFLYWNDGEKKWNGKMYDIFGESELSDIVLTRKSFHFIKTYENQAGIKCLLCVLMGPFASEDIPITNETIVGLPYCFSGSYNEIVGDLTSVTISTMKIGQHIEIPEEFRSIVSDISET